MPAALCTPGSSRMRADRASRRTSSSRAVADTVRQATETRAVSRPSARNPGSMFCSRTKLRISRPAPVSSTSDSATSATTSVASVRRERGPRAVAAAFAQRVVGARRREQRRDEAEQQARCQRGEQREGDDRKIKRHLIEARNGNAIGDQREQAAMKRDRQREAERHRRPATAAGSRSASAAPAGRGRRRARFAGPARAAAPCCARAAGWRR